MNRIVVKKELAPKIKLMEFENPDIAARARPGQFVVIQMGEKGERFPLTISGTDLDKGTVRLIFNEVGKSSRRLGTLSEGEDIDNVTGPLGNPTEIEKFGTVLCLGGGVMIGPMAYEVAAFKEAGNRLITVIGARNKELLILKAEMKALSDGFYMSTDDGSEGYTGLDFLREIFEREKIDRVIAMSAATATLRALCELTKTYGIKTIVSLTPIMLDGTGMCGVCRASIGGEIKFTCVDGPEFDGHLVDWDELESRKRAYSHEERVSALCDEHVGRDFVSLSGRK
ncbi:MAG: sulfide/dihydroorotate dehydrogenase-like FAD/NAD-binding protein [Dehalococcoidia bacterium]